MIFHPKRFVSAGMAVAIGLALATVSPTAEAGDWYAVIEGGLLGSDDRSNQDDVEFGNEPGGSLGVGAGRRFTLAGSWFVSTELQLTGQTVPLHGRNDKRNATADGRFFWLAGLTANVWPEYRFDDRWSILGGGGAGPAVIRAFGSTAATWMVHGGAAVRYWASHDLAIEGGGRYYWTAPARVNGAQARYDSYGPVFRLSWFFQ